jgi:hypothetical protein
MQETQFTLWVVWRWLVVGLTETQYVFVGLGTGCLLIPVVRELSRVCSVEQVVCRMTCVTGRITFILA